MLSSWKSVALALLCRDYNDCPACGPIADGEMKTNRNKHTMQKGNASRETGETYPITETCSPINSHYNGDRGFSK